MPIKDVQDAIEVHEHIEEIFGAASPDERAQAIRQLFVETLDFNPDSGQISLSSAPAGVSLPQSAERIAVLDGVNVCYIALNTQDTDRVRKQEAVASARLLAKQLTDDLLLVCTNTSRSQLHFIHPTFEAAQPTLRRMVVEQDLPRRTAVQQIANIYSSYVESGSIRTALHTAFDVEPVTERFFAEYRRVFEDAVKLVAGFDTDCDDEAEAKRETEAKRTFVQTTFNRLMFVHFVSRQGWLHFHGSKDYLNALWKSYSRRQNESNFHRDRLAPLFFHALNNPNYEFIRDSDSELGSLCGEAKFLNGGLFEQTDLDARPTLYVPDEAIEPILKDLIDQFNFTVMESTPFDIEIAVDPEMLGKVFEELVNERKSTGAFYTPRTIVTFMCREALKRYLHRRTIDVSEHTIQEFVDSHTTSSLSINAARAIATALERVKVIDPACGSGAYLLGMLQELVDLQTSLYKAGVASRDLYELKLHIIERNLYGADNDSFAVNIAMLRLWLSLAIEYDGSDPPSLPNLDFKIVCGDSLLGPDPSAEHLGDLFVDHDSRLILGSLKASFLRAKHPDEKETLRQQIVCAEDDLAATSGDAAIPTWIVDWRVTFAEVFHENEGFDIALANPPYVRHEDIGDSKPALRAIYASSTSARSDLYCYFYVRALQIIRSGGIQVFVCSNTWLDAVYGTTLQRYLLNHSHLDRIYESAIERQFSTAAVNTIISILSKVTDSTDGTTSFVTFMSPFTLASIKDISRRDVTVSRADLQASLIDSYSGRRNARAISGKWGGKYLRAPDVYTAFMDHASSAPHRLGDLVRGERYLNTGGADGFFVLSDVTPHSPELMRVRARSKEGNEWGNPQFLIETEFLRPGYRRSGSPHLRIRKGDCYILAIPPDTEVSRYRVSDYIEWAEDAGFDQRSVTRTLSPWWKPPLQAQSGATILMAQNALGQPPMLLQSREVCVTTLL